MRAGFWRDGPHRRRGWGCRGALVLLTSIGMACASASDGLGLGFASPRLLPVRRAREGFSSSQRTQPPGSKLDVFVHPFVKSTVGDTRAKSGDIFVPRNEPGVRVRVRNTIAGIMGAFSGYMAAVVAAVCVCVMPLRTFAAQLSSQVAPVIVNSYPNDLWFERLFTRRWLFNPDLGKRTIIEELQREEYMRSRLGVEQFLNLDKRLDLFNSTIKTTSAIVIFFLVLRSLWLYNVKRTLTTDVETYGKVLDVSAPKKNKGDKKKRRRG